MTFKGRQLNSMTFQAWKMKFLNSMTFQVFHDLYEPWDLGYHNIVLNQQENTWKAAKSDPYRVLSFIEPTPMLIDKREGLMLEKGCLPFTKRFRKKQSRRKWNTKFWVAPVENLKRTECLNGNLCSISSKPSLIPVSAFRGGFSAN